MINELAYTGEPYLRHAGESGTPLSVHSVALHARLRRSMSVKPIHLNSTALKDGFAPKVAELISLRKKPNPEKHINFWIRRILVRFPRAFIEAYPVGETAVITPGNYIDWLR